MSLTSSSKSVFYVDLEETPSTEIVEEGYAVYAIRPKKMNVSSISVTHSLPRQFHNQQAYQLTGIGRGSSHKVRVLMAGSLEAIVEGLTPAEDAEDKVDCLHMNILLSTYPAFSSTEQLLTTLFGILQGGGSGRMDSGRLRAALLVTLNAWLGDPYQEHFRKPTEFADLRLLAELCERAAADFKGSEEGTRLDLLTRQARRRFETFGAAVATGKKAASARQHWPRMEWEDFEDLQVAEQLTRIDSHLFESLHLHECLGSQWGRHKRLSCSPTVEATVKQFNRLCSVVATSILQLEQTLEERARRLTRWIRVAQYLRERRNFSSLFAIVFTLNSENIRRLSRVWRRVPTSARDLLAELALLADSSNNFEVPRNLIGKEGTGRGLSRQTSVPAAAAAGHYRAGSNLSISEQSSGTIPYLGTSLTDLEGINSAFQDEIRGLVNFDKRRREYDILARLRLYQVTCRQYMYCDDARFDHWFNFMELMTDEQLHQSSFEIQPERRTESHTDIPSLASDISLEGQGDPKEQSKEQSQKDQSQKDQSTNVLIVHFRLDLPAGHSGTPLTGGQSVAEIYKSVFVTSSDKTDKVIKAVMNRYDLDDSPEFYVIVQSLANGTESVLPDGANVFYALSTTDAAPVFSSGLRAPGDGASGGGDGGPKRLRCILRHRQVQGDKIIGSARKGAAVLRRLLLPWI